jgi:hypothetical protein
MCTALQHYSNHDIVSFLESIGASFGACQNAYTSADETVYTLMVPTADGELLDKSIAVLSEFAARIRYVLLCAGNFGKLHQDTGCTGSSGSRPRGAFICYCLPSAQL